MTEKMIIKFVFIARNTDEREREEPGQRGNALKKPRTIYELW